MMTNALLRIPNGDNRVEIVTPFNYGSLPPEQVTVVQAAVHLIRVQFCKTIAAMVEAGEHLAQVKAILPHGSFGQWLAAEFGMTPRSAERYIRMAEVLPGKTDTVSHLPVGLVHQLVAPTIPDEVRAEILAEAEKTSVQESELKARLSFARAEARRRAAEAAHERKLSPEQRKRRKARLDRQKHDWAAEREAQDRERLRRAELTQGAVDHVLHHLDADARSRLRELLTDADAWRFKEALLSACELEGSQ